MFGDPWSLENLGIIFATFFWRKVCLEVVIPIVHNFSNIEFQVLYIVLEAP